MTTATPIALTEAIEVVLLEAIRMRHLAVKLPIERRLRAKVKAAFRRQGAHFAQSYVAAQRHRTRFLTEVEEADWVPYFLEAVHLTDTMFREAAMEAAANALVAGAETAIADLNIGLTYSFDLANPRAVAYLQSAGGNMVANITETTRERIRTIMAQATSEGWSYQRTATNIRKLYSGFSTPSPLRHIRDRAELIAVTESGNAYEAGNAIVVKDMQASGLNMEKRWLTVGDARVDLPECEANQSQGWISASDQFQSGHSEPLAHPGCRCTCLYRVEGTEG